jgi:anti-sigma factor RsiW
MDHADARALLHGAIDGELDAASALALERHVGGCDECQRERAALLSLRAELRKDGVAFTCPPELAARLREQLAGPQKQADTPGVTAPVIPGPQPRRRWVMAAAVAALVAILCWWEFAPRGPTAAEITAVVAGHVRSLLADHLIDKASSDQHTVKPWFAGRIDYAPAVTDFTNDGFPLVGGRLDYLDDKTIAALVYKRHLHVINCYQWPEKGGDSSQVAVSERGYHLITWRRDGSRWWLVSDLNAEELGQLAGLLQAH